MNTKGDEAGTMCPVCKGKRIIRYNVPVGHENFGKIFPCPEVERHAKDNRKRLFTESGLEHHERYNLDDLMHINDMTREMIAVAKKFLERPRGWLYLWGGYGTSKTVVLQCITTHFIRKGRTAYYTTFADLRDVMMESMKKPERGDENFDYAWRRWKTYGARLGRLRRLYSLCIDEMDEEKITGDWTAAFRGQLLDHRYRTGTTEKGGTVTVFAGNRNPDHLPGWLADRVNDGRFIVFENKGESIRPQMEWYHDV